MIREASRCSNSEGDVGRRNDDDRKNDTKEKPPRVRVREVDIGSMSV